MKYILYGAFVWARRALKRPFRRFSARAVAEAGELDMIWHVGDIGSIDDAFAHDPLRFVYEEAYNGYMNWLSNLTAAMPCAYLEPTRPRAVSV
jgi:hypothetical protein